MAKTHYVAFLRGINVGGKNIIKMADLRQCLKANKLENVRTYIQSGNILFEAKKETPAVLAATIGTILEQTFGYKAPIVVRSQAEMEQIINQAPKGFGSQPDKYRYNVIFLKEPLSSSEAIKTISIREGVDTAAIGPGVLYFSNLISRATQSHLSKIVSLPIYKQITIRNWNTTTKLMALLNEDDQK